MWFQPQGSSMLTLHEAGVRDVVLVTRVGEKQPQPRSESPEGSFPPTVSRLRFALLGCGAGLAVSFLLGSKAGQNPRDLEARQRRRSQQGRFLERLQSIPDPADTTRSVDRAARYTHMKAKVHLFHNKGQYRSLHDPLPVAGHKPAPPALPAQVRHA